MAYLHTGQPKQGPVEAASAWVKRFRNLHTTALRPKRTAVELVREIRDNPQEELTRAAATHRAP